MRPSLYVDTTAWYAAADLSDPLSARAQAILSNGVPLLTSDHVLEETWRLTAHRLGASAAYRFWDGIRCGVAEVECVTSADLEVAWSIHERFPDQELSLVDLTSFAVMLRRGIHRVASFDGDFAIFRFGRNRDKAFTIVR